MLNELIEDYAIAGCCVRDKSSFALVCQKWEVDDPLVPHETRILTCDLSGSGDGVWHSYDIGTTTGLHCCPVFSPAKGWVFVTDMSDVCFCESGNILWEEKVSSNPKTFTFKVKCINNGYVYSVGPKRSVYKRESPNKWVKLESGMKFAGSSIEMGFDDIDGFSDDDLYACGGDADLWKFDGVSWDQIHLQTNSRIKYVCCGGDGYTYLVTSAKSHLLCGRDDEWFEIEKEEKRKEFLGRITWFNDGLMLLTTSNIYKVNRLGFTKFDTTGCGLTSFAHMASTKEVLMLTNYNEVSLFDGATWQHLK